MRYNMIHEVSHITVDVEKQKQYKAEIQELTEKVEELEMVISLLYGKIKAEDTKEDNQ